MPKRSERVFVGAVASLAAAAFFAAAASAGEVAIPQDPTYGPSSQPCSAAGESCPRIKGYIRAGSDPSAASGERPGVLALPPPLAGLPLARAFTRDLGLLPVSGQPIAR